MAKARVAQTKAENHEQVLVEVYTVVTQSLLGSGGGLVGRAVASYTKGPWFDSHQQHQ